MHTFTRLVTLFQEQFIGNLPFPKEPQRLYDPCRYLLTLEGKRIRPVLCLMANELMGEISADAWHAAAAIELFHNFTLVHDDIMDNAPLRRGSATIHEKYGITTGILSGDVLCIKAYEQLAHIKNKLPEVFYIFNTTARQVCEGQQWDMDYESVNNVSEDEYINMITLKTSVLLAGALQIGALLGGATFGVAQKLYDLGRSLGIAFQLKDDYLDAFGDPESLGKQIGGDIKASKKTFLSIHTANNATPLQQSELMASALLPDYEKIATTKRIFTETGAEEAIKEAINHYSTHAFQLLEEIPIISKRKEPLKELANFLLSRNY